MLHIMSLFAAAMFDDKLDLDPDVITGSQVFRSRHYKQVVIFRYDGICIRRNDIGSQGVIIRPIVDHPNISVRTKGRSILQVEFFHYWFPYVCGNTNSEF